MAAYGSLLKINSCKINGRRERSTYQKKIDPRRGIQLIFFPCDEKCSDHYHKDWIYSIQFEKYTIKYTSW